MRIPSVDKRIDLHLTEEEALVVNDALDLYTDRIAGVWRNRMDDEPESARNIADTAIYRIQLVLRQNVSMIYSKCEELREKLGVER